MRRFKTNALISILVVTSFITTTTVTDSMEVYARNYVSQNVKLTQSKSYNKKTSHDTKHATGLKPLTKQDKQWLKENAVDTKDVALNKIGLKRINEVRTKKGIKPIDSSKAVRIGDEVTLGNSAAEGKSVNNRYFTQSANTAEAVSADTSNLPETVDNSELPYFPAIGDQGRLGSCASFSTTYYQATYMNALANGWDIKDNPDDSKIFSTKWTYDLINGGKDLGSHQIDAYQLFKEQGIATQKDFPYTGKAGDYLEWPTNPEVWKNASQNRLDKMGDGKIHDGTDTPVKDVNSPNLNKVKQFLNDGYVLDCCVAIDDNVSSTVNDNPDSHKDDKYVGQKIIYAGAGPTDHGMCIVGYNDDIWVDMNGNGKVDDGEKGAFKLANSWGTNTGGNDNSGFIWISYDALNKVSSLKTPPVYPERRNVTRYSAMGDNEFYWITIKSANIPRFLVQVDMNSAYRDQFEFQLGYSEVNDTNTQVTWQPQILGSDCTGDYSFNGTTTASDGVVVLDYSNFLPPDLSNTKKRWYVKIIDKNWYMPNKVSPVGIIKGFKFIDPSCANEVVEKSNSNYQINCAKASLDSDYKLAPSDCIKIDKDNSVTLSADYNLTINNAQTSKWKYKNNLDSSYSHFHNIITYNNKIYTICANDYKTNIKLIQYDPDSDKWNVLNSISFSQPTNIKYHIFALDGKIYTTEANGTTHTYDISTNTWSVDSTFSFPQGLINYSLVTLNDKLYVIGGDSSKTGKSPVNTVWEYDPSAANHWTQKANMNSSMEYPIISVAKDASDGKDKIYVLGGQGLSLEPVTQIQKYDPLTNTWVNDGINPYFDSKGGFNNTKYSYCAGAAAAIDDNIYMLTNYKNNDCIYKYNTKDKDWVQEGASTPVLNCINVCQLNNKIYAINCESNSYDGCNNAFEFDPSISDEKPIVGIPRFSIPGGTYNNQKVSLSSSTPEATIMYTTDGTDPTGASAIVYKEPISIDRKMTIKAVAIKDGYVNSYVVAANYDHVPTVNSPKFSIPSGAYKYMQKVSITCDTPNAVIKYTTDGTDPTTDSATYTEPITLHDNMTVKAIAIKDGYVNSPITSASYKAPSFVGDVNGDGNINSIDIMLIARYASGKITCFPNIDDDMWAGDLNGDGKIDSTDVSLVKSYVQNNISYFPKEQPTIPNNFEEQSTTPSSISISWLPSKAVGAATIDHYEVYRDGKLIDTCKYDGYTDSTVTISVKYSYTVVAVDSEGRKSAASNAFVVSTDGIG